jgi:hypothetical protein
LTRARLFPQSLRPGETLENAEQLVSVSFIEARAVISNEDHRCAVLLDLANFDKDDFPTPGIFDGIRKQVVNTCFTKPASHFTEDNSPMCQSI